MNAPHDLDRRLDDWLRDGPSHAPERTIVAALQHARAHPRRRDLLAALRRDPMGSTGFGSGSGLRVMPLVAALALLLVAALAVATVGGLFQRQAVVVPPLTTPSPSATATPQATSSPSPSATATATPTTIRVDFVDEVGGKAFIEITDRSGRLVNARSGPENEGPSFTGDIGVANAPGDPATLVLGWVGCPSDTRYVMAIAADGRTMSIDQPACQGDTLGVARVLVLTFDDPVPASDVTATIRVVGG
jgi:hypothetical protein